jgi:hypothetical protein
MWRKTERASFEEEAFDEVEPGAVLWRKGELEVAGRLIGEPSSRFLGDMRGMIVEDQVDRHVGRVGRSRSLRKSMNSRLRGAPVW